MKRLVSLLILLASFQFISAQTDESSCYNQWAKAFESRGAEDVKDGWHEGVIISIRTGSKNRCYNAKVQVDAGAIKEIYIKYVDGKYEPFKPEWKYPDQKGLVMNGITKTLQTKEDDLINIIFINHLKPKKKAYEVAPLPGPDDF